MLEPWSDPDNEGEDDWQKPEPPSIPLYVPTFGLARPPAPPTCPRCRGPVEFRIHDGGRWCRVCDEWFRPDFPGFVRRLREVA